VSGLRLQGPDGVGGRVESRTAARNVGIRFSREGVLKVIDEEGQISPRGTAGRSEVGCTIVHAAGRAAEQNQSASTYSGSLFESAKRMKLFFDGLELKKLSELPPAKWKDRQVVVGKLHRADTAGEMTPIYIDVASISAPNGAPGH
jgi:hypothetical protein